MNPQYQRGVILYEQGRFGDAEREFRGAVGERPGEAVGHAMLALCLARLMKFREAEEEAGTAIGLDPEEGFAHYAMGVVLHERRRYGEAGEAVSRAVAIDPHNCDYWGLLGQVRMSQRDWAGALSAADRGLEVDAEHDTCTNVRASALVHLGRRGEAAATMEGALGRDPENAWTHANRGWGLLHEGKPREAMTHFREALRLEPEMEWARAGIVEALKAHNVIYRWMLAYFLWMSRLSGRARWGVILGGYFGSKLLRGLATAEPAVGPFVWPVVIAYSVFAIMTWVAEPMFNLLLQLNKFGRMTLSRDQRVGSMVFGGLLVAAAGCVVGAVVAKELGLAVIGVALALLTLPASGMWACQPGWPRVTMGVVTGTMAVIGIGSGVLLFWAKEGHKGRGDWPTDTAVLGLVGFMVMLLGSQFLGGWLGTVRPKR